jgi:transposase
LGRTSAAGAERNPAPRQRQTAKPDKAEFVVCESTIYNRFVRWREAGVWDRILNAVSAAYDGDLIMIDSSCVRVHQHGATGKKGIKMVAWDVPVAA